MKCDEFQMLLEAEFDGEGTSEPQIELNRHLDSCADCRAFLAQLRSESEIYSAYSSDVNVPVDLWTKVQARIEAPPLESANRGLFTGWLSAPFSLPRVSVWATAVLVLAAIGVTVAVMKYVGNQSAVVSKPEQSAKVGQLANDASPNPNQISEPQKKADDVEQAPALVAHDKTPRTSAPRPRGNTPDQLVQDAEQKYLTAIAMLSRTAQRKRSQLDPGSLARLDQALASVDRTIAGTRKVVRQHPDDPVAVQYMLSAYSRKVDVLREMIGY
ncbi:MAG TPA: zf-HC2 domain-containing protein [Pyrinomonadaceae bacterium]|nr:zf-HC2 domain-containing protein [Pyrinomonadaceae bacterium]